MSSYTSLLRVEIASMTGASTLGCAYSLDAAPPRAQGFFTFKKEIIAKPQRVFLRRRIIRG
uniref:Uncharacterized protein n=1 Tax=Strigamia maritima TaxID=126957 RepID=T1J6D9_STRMM